MTHATSGRELDARKPSDVENSTPERPARAPLERLRDPVLRRWPRRQRRQHGRQRVGGVSKLQILACTAAHRAAVGTPFSASGAGEVDASKTGLALLKTLDLSNNRIGARRDKVPFTDLECGRGVLELRLLLLKPRDRLGRFASLGLRCGEKLSLLRRLARRLGGHTLERSLLLLQLRDTLGLQRCSGALWLRREVDAQCLQLQLRPLQLRAVLTEPLL